MLAVRAREAAHYNTEEAFTYYVDSVSGSDAHAGTKAAPFKTAGYAFTQWTAGESIGLKAGGTYRVTSSLGLPGAGNRLGCYGCLPGASNMPILDGGQVVTGTWTVSSGNIYSASFTPNNSNSPSFATYTSGGNILPLSGAGSSSYTASTVPASGFYYASDTIYVNLGGTNPVSGVVEASTTRTSPIGPPATIFLLCAASAFATAGTITWSFSRRTAT